jgi:hypothetical protein
MTMSENPQWCTARFTAVLGHLRVSILRDDGATPAAIPATLPTISVRCLLGRGHTGQHQTSVRDEKVMFK